MKRFLLLSLNGDIVMLWKGLGSKKINKIHVRACNMTIKPYIQLCSFMYIFRLLQIILVFLILVVSLVLVVVSLGNGNNVGTGTPSEHDGKHRSPRSPYRDMKNVRCAHFPEK